MAYGFLDIAITPGVEALQESLGTAHLWRDFKGNRSFAHFTANEIAFLAERDSFYMATVSETSWPYVQHRGGPAGFLKVLDETTLAFADYAGNRQYLSTGNLSSNNRVALILMDYAHRARLKIFAEADVVALDTDPALAAQVQVPGYKARSERIIKLHLKAFDWNCPQHITPRFTSQEITEASTELLARIDELAAENAALRARLVETMR